MHRIIYGSLLILVAVPWPARPAPAQVERAAIGGAIGAGGGAVITLSAVVARARFQEDYLESMQDLIHWQSIPMIAAPAAGVAFGWAGVEPLKWSIIGSVGGMALGTAVGAGVGWLSTDQASGPWAGGAIGAGVGLTLGGLLGGVLAWTKGESNGGAPAGPAVEIRIPLGGWRP